MKHRWISAISFIYLMSGASYLQAADATRGPITVVLCDRAGLDTAYRIEAKGQASRILATAKVAIEWIESCEGIAKASFYTLILVAEPAADDHLTAHSMGKAVVLKGPYPRAYVYLNRVKLFDYYTSSLSSVRDEAILFGHAMAHELGHLLGQPHAVSGIMAGSWGVKERNAALKGAMIFNRMTASAR